MEKNKKIFCWLAAGWQKLKSWDYFVFMAIVAFVVYYGVYMPWKESHSVKTYPLSYDYTKVMAPDGVSIINPSGYTIINLGYGFDIYEDERLMFVAKPEASEAKYYYTRNGEKLSEWPITNVIYEKHDGRPCYLLKTSVEKTVLYFPEFSGWKAWRKETMYFHFSPEGILFLQGDTSEGVVFSKEYLGGWQYRGPEYLAPEYRLVVEYSDGSPTTVVGIFGDKVEIIRADDFFESDYPLVKTVSLAKWKAHLKAHFVEAERMGKFQVMTLLFSL